MSDDKTTYADCTDAEIEDLLKTALATVTELSTERRSRQQKALSEAHQKLREAQEQYKTAMGYPSMKLTSGVFTF